MGKKNEKEIYRKMVPNHVVRVEGVIVQSYGITIEDIYSSCRSKQFSDARQIIFFILHEYYGMSLPHIGRLYNRDHTTILYAARLYRTGQREIPKMLLYNFKVLIPELYEKMKKQTVDKQA